MWIEQQQSDNVCWSSGRKYNRKFSVLIDASNCSLFRGGCLLPETPFFIDHFSCVVMY
jgi:hypothetical protein